MANYAKIILTCSSLAEIDQSVNINVSYNYGVDSYDVIETCQTIRTQNNQYTRGNIASEHAYNLYNALKADNYLFDSLFSINYVGVEAVELEAKQYGVVFTNNSTATNWDAFITTEVAPEIQINITGVTISEADISPSTYAKYHVTVENYSEGGTVTILSPISQTFPDPTNISFDYPRTDNAYPVIELRDDLSSKTSSIRWKNVSEWFLYDPPVIVQDNPSSYMIGLSNSFHAYSGRSGEQYYFYTEKLFSLDGVNYQSSIYFYGIVPGNYTGYMKDSIGGLWTINFDVIAVNADKPEPFFDISRINSIHFSNDSQTGNFFSRFERQIFTNIEFQNFAQDFKNTDTVNTQIRSNYETITASLRNYCTGDILKTFTVTDKIINIGKKDKRDCNIISTGSGKTYIYFTYGNTYDTVTNEIIGSFNLNSTTGTLLENWMQAGNKVTISGGSAIDDLYEVQAIEYKTGIGYCLVLDINYTGSLFLGKCESTYNAEVWNVKEFLSDFSTLSDGFYDIYITASDTDPRYTDVNWISEPIQISTCEKSVLIEYSTDTRTILNIVPDTGITHKLRIPGRFYDYTPKTENQTFKSDVANQYILRRENAINHIIETDPIPAYLVDKLNNALSHDNVLINGINYTAIEEPDVESWAKDNNPFLLFRATMQYNDVAISASGVGIVTGATGTVLGTNTADVLGV